MNLIREKNLGLSISRKGKSSSFDNRLEMRSGKEKGGWIACVKKGKEVESV